MSTHLAAYDAAPLPPPPPAPLAVYFVEDGHPTEIVGIDDFDITVENPTSEGADAPEMDITLEYDPSNPEHRALMAAGEGGIVTIRVAHRATQTAQPSRAGRWTAPWCATVCPWTSACATTPSGCGSTLTWKPWATSASSSDRRVGGAARGVCASASRSRRERRGGSSSGELRALRISCARFGPA